LFTYLKVRVRVVPVNTLPNAIEIIRPSVVQICLGPGKKRKPIGTGFIIHKSGYALTARHVTAYVRSLASDSEEFIAI
jgi:S1-C subfamily serine protease